MRLAVIALAAALAGSCSASPPPPATPVAPLEAVAPSGQVSWPFEFRWKGAGPAVVVRIVVVDEAERPLKGIEARGDHVAAPDSLKSVLRPGLRYQWRVARVDAYGEEVDASALTTFELRE